MRELFLSVLNMSLTASYVILFVIVFRLLLKRAPKFISYSLWGVVAFRLIFPFSFESMFSLLPRNTNTVRIPHSIFHQQNPQINNGIGAVDSFAGESLPAPPVGASVNPLQVYVEVGAYIWVLGIIALLFYSFVSILILKRQLKSAQLIERYIFEAKNLKTPFVLGLIKPRMYLPVGLMVEERDYILLHEKAHINRKDHIVKILAFLILCMHWFNPLVWVAFMLMCTDMELSCDERVLRKMNEDIKKSYANSLLSLATGRHIINGSPLAFGEGNVKERIKNVLRYKKQRFWVVIVSIIIVTAVGIGLIANPKIMGLEKPNHTSGSVEETAGDDPAIPAGSEGAEEIPKDNSPEQVGDKGSEPAEANTQIVNVYFICSKEDPGGLYPVDRIVSGDADPLQGAIEEMLKGTTQQEKELGYMSHFSAQTAGMLNSVKRSDDGKTITIDFADFRSMIDRNRIPSPTSFVAGGIMADITWTVFMQFPDVETLRFSFDGDEGAFWSWLAGEHHEPETFTRTDWEQV